MKTLFIIYLGVLSFAWSAFLENIPVTLHQPDGSTISCFSSGDEYYVRLHNSENYTIIQNADDGFYYYAQMKKSKVVPSHYRADQPISVTANLHAGVYISKDEYLNRRINQNQERGRDAPTIGTINNIVGTSKAMPLFINIEFFGF